MNENLERRLRFCANLPSLPAIAIKVIELAKDPDTSVSQICDQIILDPALSAKLLKIANTPLYQTRRSVTNLRQAIGVLGTHAAVMIALSFFLPAVFKGQSAGRIDLNIFWRRAIYSALACRTFGHKLGHANLEEFFLAGLLQDIGMLAFDRMLPDEYAYIFSAAIDHENLRTAEIRAFGAGHDEVGKWLLEHWNLPDYLIKACADSHMAPLPLDGVPDLFACIAVSGAIADLLLHPTDEFAASHASKRAAAFLGMSPDDLSEVLDQMAATMAMVEELFDISVLQPGDVEAIAAEAKDLLILRELSKVRELEEKSQRDALTGAHNRGYFDDALRREFDLANRHRWPLSVALVDLDHFKLVNDTYGHPVGDIVLISVVRATLGQLRQGDIFARYGGEEFAIILPGTGIQAALKLAQRINQTIAAIVHEQDTGKPILITASIGVVAHEDGGTLFSTPAEMIRAVDEALYWAKSGGRNQVVQWYVNASMIDSYKARSA